VSLIRAKRSSLAGSCLSLVYVVSGLKLELDHFFSVMKFYDVFIFFSFPGKHLQNVNDRDSSFSFPERLTLKHCFHLESPFLSGGLEFQ
jgi:hypothetical protein